MGLCQAPNRLQIIIMNMVCTLLPQALLGSDSSICYQVHEFQTATLADNLLLGGYAAGLVRASPSVLRSSMADPRLPTVQD